MPTKEGVRVRAKTLGRQCDTYPLRSLPIDIYRAGIPAVDGLRPDKRVRGGVKLLDPARPLERFWERLAAARERLLVLDYDGTLAPFTTHRDDAILYPGIAPILLDLQRQGTRIAFVTGRPAEELARRLPLSAVEIFGAHGHEHLAADGTLTRAPLTPPAREWLDEAAARIGALGFAGALERKHGTVAIHWRREDQDGQARLMALAADLTQGLPEELHGLPFDGGYEFRTRGRDKGTAIAALSARHPQAIMAYLGDDLTDEDAFAALPHDGLAVLVRAEPRPSRAHLWLRPPDELRGFLSAWMAAAP